MLKCYKCSSTTFTIEVKDNCIECDKNGEWDETENEFVTIREGDNLRQVEADGQCQIGHSYGNGCRRIYCAKCNNFTDFIPMI